MKTYLTAALLLCLSFFQSQVKQVDIVDFYNWTSNDGIHYQFIVIAGELTELDVRKPALVRVRYSTDGGVSYKIAEFDSTLRFTADKSNSDQLIAYLDAGQTAKIIQGNGGYTPDNFILYYNRSGDYLEGYQADHTEMSKSNIEYAKVFLTPTTTADQIRSLVRLFYKQTEPMYRDLMTYAAKYD